VLISFKLKIRAYVLQAVSLLILRVVLILVLDIVSWTLV
jgi:hypothetical protein